MPIDQRKLISVMRSEVDEAIGRYDGYRHELFDYVSQIVMLEREHLRRATVIQKKVNDRIESLGLLIAKKGE